MAKFSNVELEPAGYFSIRKGSTWASKQVQASSECSPKDQTWKIAIFRYNTGSITIHKHDVPHHTHW